MKELVKEPFASRTGAPDRQLRIVPFSDKEVFKVREAAYRQLGFEGSNDLRNSKTRPDFWEKDERDKVRVAFSARMMLTLPYDEAKKFEDEWRLWEKGHQERARIVFSATMSFINLSLKTGRWEIDSFYEALKLLSQDKDGREDEALRPPAKREGFPEDKRELEIKLKRAQQLNDEDPSQILFWENKGLATLPNEIQDYLMPMAATIIRLSVIPDYGEILRKKGIIIEGKRSWQKSIDPNVKETTFLRGTQREIPRNPIEIYTGEKPKELTFDQNQAFISVKHEPSVYIKRFSYSAAITHWAGKFEEVWDHKSWSIKTPGAEDQRVRSLAEAKKRYSSDHYNVVFSKAVKEGHFSPSHLNALLGESSISPHELHEQACIALHGPGSEKYNISRYVLGLKALEKAFWLTGDPLFAMASKLENERLRDKQRVTREQKKLLEKSSQEKALKHHEGEEEFQTQQYWARVEHWMSVFVDLVGEEGYELYRKYGDLHERNVETLGLKERNTIGKPRKKTVRYYRHLLDNHKDFSPVELYAEALNALRNPFKNEVRSSEAAGFELLERAIETADTKIVYIRAYIDELIRKWVLNKSEVESEPLIKSKIFMLLETLVKTKNLRKEAVTTVLTKNVKPASDEELPF